MLAHQMFRHALRVVNLIDQINERIGHAAAWLTLSMVLVQFMVVVLRYAFGIGSILLQEAVIYMHGILFMVAAASALLHDAHVRVDIFYANMSAKHQMLVNLLGHAFLVMPFCVMLVLVSWDYIAIAWSVREGSRETSGIQGVYLMKSIILVFAVQLGLQALSGIIVNLARLSGFASPMNEATK